MNPSSGTISVNGRISALLELGAGFNPEYTGIENIYLNGTLNGITREEMSKRIDDIADFADIGDFINQPVKNYSSGMFVRLAFAVAVYSDPDILIVDEALAVGDAAFQAKCMARMNQIMKSGATVLFVTHDMNTVKRLCQRCIYLENGKKIMEGDAAELADIYFQKNNKMEYEYLLREIVTDPAATTEQLESAYGKLIAIYAARDDYKTIDDLLQNCGNVNIMSKYQSYMAMEPEFSLQEGYYTSIQPLKLTTFGSGKIYYTMDGSEPDADSSLYTAPILLESGDYCVKAIYINENDISSKVVTKDYHIEIEKLSAPDVTAVSGDYEFPINIEVSDGEDVYYTTDGSDPTQNSSVYTGPIPMPLGKSVFRFIRIAEGRKSEIVEKSYNLALNTAYTLEEAVQDVVNYCIQSGRIWDASGSFDESGAAYLYQYQYVTNINKVDDFYVIAEIYRGEDGTLTRTGNLFAANAYTRELYKLQLDENSRQYHLTAV